MLFAFAGADGAADAALERAVRNAGKVTGSLRARGTLIAAWPSASNARVERDLGFGVEGRFEQQSLGRPLSLESVRECRGDFALLAATPDGVLVTAGAAGGYRPVYVAPWPAGG